MAIRANYLNEKDPTVSLAQTLHPLKMGRNSCTMNKIADGNLLKMSSL
jgi:hypothetical protein